MAILYCFSFVFGLCIGSFLNAVVYRLPRKISLSTSRSKCPNCEKLIPWYENVPLFSFLFLKGKCSKCDFKIPLQYPILELVVGLFCLFITPTELGQFQVLNYFFKTSIFATFVAIFIIDLKHKLIPNVLNIYLVINLLPAVILSKSWVHWLGGASLGVLFPLAVTYGFYLIKGQVGLGGGDIKLYGALGLFLGPSQVMYTIFLSCFVGALVGGLLIIFKVVDRKTPIPFGPFIIIVAFFQIFFPDQYGWFLSSILNASL